MTERIPQRNRQLAVDVRERERERNTRANIHKELESRQLKQSTANWRLATNDGLVYVK